MGEEKRPEEAPLEAALATSEPATAHWLEPIYRDHSAVVLQTAYRVTGNAADAEDVLQTVFIRLARRADPPDLSRAPSGISGAPPPTPPSTSSNRAPCDPPHHSPRPALGGRQGTDSRTTALQLTAR